MVSSRGSVTRPQQDTRQQGAGFPTPSTGSPGAHGGAGPGAGVYGGPYGAPLDGSGVGPSGPYGSASGFGAAPTGLPVGEPSRSGRGRLWIALGAVGAAVAVIIVVVVVAMGGQNSKGDVAVARADERGSADTVALATPAETSPSVTNEVETASGGMSSTRNAPPTSPRITTAPKDPDAAALAELTATADAQRSKVEGLVGRWVPQIDSKRHGMTDVEGVAFWGHEQILDNYRSYLGRFPDALLVRSDDFATFEPGYWVVLVPDAFSDYDGALGWCRDEGFDRDHCFAKLVSHDASIEPNAEYLPED